MGWLQEVVWNQLFQWSYPIAFTGAVFYGILAVTTTDMSKIVSNPNLIIFINVLVGLAGLMSYARWFNINLSSLNFITSYIDLDIEATRLKVNKGL